MDIKMSHIFVVRHFCFKKLSKSATINVLPPTKIKSLGSLSLIAFL